MPPRLRSEVDCLRAIDGNTKNPRDDGSGALQSITFAHHKLHDGDAYSVDDVITLGDGGVREILIITPNTTKWAHMVFSAATALKGQAELFEGAQPGYIAANAIPIYNRNRNSSNTSGLLVCHTPGNNSSSSSSGEAGVEVRLAFQAWGAVGLGNNPGHGGGDRGTVEWMLKQDETYLVRVTSQAATNVCSIHLDWYENTSVRP